MPELTPQQKQKLQDELVKYAKEGATDDQLRSFKASLIQEFESQNTGTTTTVKKKEVSAEESETAGDALQSGIDAIPQSSSPLESTSEGVVDNRPDIFEGMRQQAARINTPATPSTAAATSIQFSREIGGYKAVITKESLPDGYEKSDEGIRQYMIDTGVKMFSKEPTVRKAVKEELITVSETRRLREDPNIAKKIVSVSDREELNNIIGTPVVEINEDVWVSLRNKRKESLNAQKEAFESNNDNFRFDNKTGRKIFTKEFKPDVAVYDKLIEKVGGEIQNEVVSSGQVTSVVQADTDSDLTAFTRTLPQAIKSAQSRQSVENLNNSFLTGLEALKYTDENSYNLYKKRLADGKSFSSTVMAQLTNNGASIISARNLKKLSDKSIGLDEFANKEQEVGKALADNFYNRPDILQKQVASVIGEYRAKKNGAWGLLGEWSVSDKEIDAVPAEYFTEKGIDINRPEVKAAIQKIKDNEGVLPFDNAVQKDGLAREIWRGAAQPVKGVANFFGNLAVSDNERLLQIELDPVANYSKKRTEYFDKHYGMLADAFNGLGQFATQYLLMEAGVGLSSALGAGAKTSSLIGQIAVPYLQSYDDYYKTALQQTDNQFAAKIYAFTNAGMEAMSERLFNNIEFGRQVIKNFSGVQVNANKLAKIFDKKVFDEAAQQEFKEVVEIGLKQSIRTVAGGVKGLAAESFEEVPVALTNFITDAMINPKSIEGRDVFGEVKDAFLSGMVSFSIPSLLGVGGKLRQQFKNKDTQEDALMVAARNSTDVKDAILSLAEDGELSEEEKNHKLQVLNTAAAALAKMPTYATGEKLDEVDQVKYLSLSVQERFIKEENAKIDDQAVIAVNEQKLKDIVAQKSDILNKTEQKEEAASLEPQQTVLQAAARGVLTGIEAEMLNRGEITADDVLLSLAKQKYGLQEDGSEIEGGGRDISMKTSIDVDEAVTAMFPNKEAVQEFINKQSNKQAEEAAQPSPQVREEGVKEDIVSVSEVLDKPATRNGIPGKLIQDGQAVVFVEDNSSREYELGNVEEIKGQSIKDWGIEQVTLPESVVSVNEAGSITVRGTAYANNFSNPVSAINRDEDGNVVSVNLETQDGKKRTFRGDVAEDIAYQIHLQQLNKDNETAEEFEQFVEADETSREEIVAAENEVIASQQTTGNNEQISRQKIEAKPRVRISAEQVEAGQDNTSPLKQNTNAVQIPETVSVPNEPEASTGKKVEEGVPEPKPEETTDTGEQKEEVADDEYNNFIDKGIVSEARLKAIANKVIEQEELTPREHEMFTSKTGEINDIIAAIPDASIVEEEDESELSGIRKALVADEIVKGVDLERISNKDMMAMGRKILDTGEVKPAILVQKILRNRAGVLTPTEVVALITYKADLDNNLRNAYKEANRINEEGGDIGNLNVEIKDLERQIDDFDVMAIITANQQSMAFRLRQNMLDRDYNVVTQIEKYKKNNDGYISPEVEAKFREYDKQLKELKAKISDLGKESDDQNGQDAVENIKESVGREKKYSEEELEKKVQEGVDTEIAKVYESLPAEKKTKADKAIAALEKFRKKLKGITTDASLGIPLAIADLGAVTAIRAIKVGQSVSAAVEAGIKRIKQALKNRNLPKWDKENEDAYRAQLSEALEADGVSLKPVKDKPIINEDGTVTIPNQMLRDLVERGITEIDELVDVVQKQIQVDLPNITKRQVRDYITEYGKAINNTADEIQQQVNAAKRLGRLLSEQEDLQKMSDGKYALQYRERPTKKNKSEREKELTRKVNSLKKTIFGKMEVSEDQRLSSMKDRTKARIEELTRKLANKDFAKKAKLPPSQDAELRKLNAEKEKLQEQFESEQYKVELKNRTFWKRAEDIALELTSGLVRGLVASLDMSAGFVQGVWRIFSNPINSAKAFGTMFNHFFSEKNSDAYMEKLQSSSIYPLLKASRLAVGQDKTGKVSAKEGFFISNWINFLWDRVVAPVVGLFTKPGTKLVRRLNPYKASQRAFDGYVNSIRVSSFIDMAKYLESKGYSFETDPKDFQKTADFVNTTTGRGSLGQADASSRWLNIFFFAPRKVISELKLFTPYVFVYYAQMPKPIRHRAILSYAKFASTYLLTNGLLHAFLRSNGDDEEPDNFWNVTSSDFLTHKIGNKRVNIAGGAKSSIVFMERMWRGEYTDQYGKTTKLGDRFGKRINSRFDLAVSYVTGKASPAFSVLKQKLDERKGQEVDDQEILQNLTVPIWMQDLKDLYKDQPQEVGALLTILSFFGANVRTVEEKKSKK